MAIQYRLNFLSLVFLSALLAPIDDGLASNWSQDLQIKAERYNYQGDTNRKNVNVFGASTNVKYLDSGSISLAYNQLTLNQSLNNRLNQQQFAFTGNLYQYIDTFRGRTGLHLSRYTITSDSFDTTSSYSGGLSYSNYSRRFYFDIFYAQSRYQHQFSNRGYSLVKQTNAAVEFVPILQSSWLSLQLFTQSNDDSILFSDNLHSMHIEWTQHLYKTGSLIPNRVLVGTQMGEQRYLVSQRLNSINNSLDRQTGGYWLSLVWQLNDFFTSGINTGYYSFQDDLDASYTATHYTLHLQINW